MTRLTDHERREVAGQSAEQRYQYFIDRAVESGQVWSLRSDDGWVEVSSEDGEPCMPVWPHPDFAAEWATDGWADCQPAAIDLDAWLSRWPRAWRVTASCWWCFPASTRRAWCCRPPSSARRCWRRARGAEG